MSFKLAFGNIKKSLKDYSIYFFTLVVAVSIFYIFNSLDSQKSMLIMNESKYEIVNTLVYLLNYVSIFISIVLGFLIVYANKFLIKRRKKEFGLYLTLGMSKRKVSMILVLETLLVGIISLVVGLLLGVFLSQFLSIFTAKLFEVNMSAYKFVFSSSALIKTIIYFGIIFVLVMIFNVITLSKNKLINLLTASKKNESVKMRNKYVIVITFILSLTLLIYAYNLLFSGVLFEMSNRVIYMLVAGALGTYFLFFSVSGFFLKVLQHIKRFYYKGLNMFTLKGISSKANTSVLSTTVISLMLLLTIGILSCAVSLVSIFNGDMNNNNRTDITIKKNLYAGRVDEAGNIITESELPDVEAFTKQDFFKDYIKEYVIYNTYNEIGSPMNTFMDKKAQDKILKQYGEEASITEKLNVMSESNYNEIMDLYNLKNNKINLKENEYILTANVEAIIEYYNLYKKGVSININGKELIPQNNEIIRIAFDNAAGANNIGTIIVDDSVLEGLVQDASVLIANYLKTDDIESFEEEFINKCRTFDVGGATSYTSKQDMKNTSIGMKVMLTFVGLYLGIIFAISSATILAISELSEASDNKSRYLVLSNIGVDNKMSNKALFNQTAVVFILPLIVALFHAFFGLREMNKTIELLGSIDLTKSIFLTALFIVIVYGGYFVATYLCSKRIVKE